MRNFAPTCRYDGTNLVLAKSDTGTNLWAFIEVGQRMIIDSGFAGQLFVCPKCGYSEFFDDNPEATANDALEEK
jgi:predicted nucleic-acid-binding Zn-ribbon protein